MTNPDDYQPTAAESNYSEANLHAQRVAEELLEHLRSNDQPFGKNWGDVGSMSNVAYLLEQAAAHLNIEGYELD